MDIVPANAGSIGADTNRSSLLIAAGEASHLGSTITSAGGAMGGASYTGTMAAPAAIPAPAHTAGITTKPTQNIRVHGAPAPAMPISAGLRAASDMSGGYGGGAAGGAAPLVMTTHTASTAAPLPGSTAGGGMVGDMVEVKPIAGAAPIVGAHPPSLTADKATAGQTAGGLRHMDANTFVAQ
jgi:hypothetical protein